MFWRKKPKRVSPPEPRPKNWQYVRIRSESGEVRSDAVKIDEAALWRDGYEIDPITLVFGRKETPYQGVHAIWAVGKFGNRVFRVRYELL